MYSSSKFIFIEVIIFNYLINVSKYVEKIILFTVLYMYIFEFVTTINNLYNFIYIIVLLNCIKAVD